MNLLIAAATLRAQGRGEWSILVLSQASPVQVRSQRCLIILSKEWLEQATPGEVVEKVAQAPDVVHPGWEATCPTCGSRYFRSKPADVEHRCDACDIPLEFA